MINAADGQRQGFNWLGFIFGPTYYGGYGAIKKAMVLAVVSGIMPLLQIVVGVYCGMRANRELPVGREPFRWKWAMIVLAVNMAVSVASFAIISKSGLANNIAMVKNGILDVDSSTTVGNAFDGYEYFKSTTWRVFTTKQGRTVVEVKAVYDTEKFIGGIVNGITLTKEIYDKAKVNFLANMVEMALITQFNISKDDITFSLATIGWKFKGKQFKTGEVTEADIPGANTETLSTIYKNKPDPMILGMLIASGQK